MRRAGALGSVAVIVALFTGMSAAGAAVATPAVTTGTLSVKTVVDNGGHGVATPDSFVYHVTDNSDSADVADGIFSPNGTTNIKLPPGSYAISEDPIEPYVEHLSNCANVTVSLGHTSKCTVTDVWTPSTITVSTTIDNTGGGTAKSNDFHYAVVDTSDNSVVQHGTFSSSGTTNIHLVNSGTYTVTEDQLAGYTEDYSQCADLTIDYLDSQVCAVGNTFDPHSTTTQSNTSTTAPSAKQSTIHGSVTTTTSCLETLQPQLQPDERDQHRVHLVVGHVPQPARGRPDQAHEHDDQHRDAGVAHPDRRDPRHHQRRRQDPRGRHVRARRVVDDAGHAHVPLDRDPHDLGEGWQGPTARRHRHPARHDVEPGEQHRSGVLRREVGHPRVEDHLTCARRFGHLHVLLHSSERTVGPRPLCATGCSPHERPRRGFDPGPGGGAGGATSGTTSGILPVTGTSVWLWLAPTVLFLSLGLLGISATTRKRRRVLNR